MIMVATVGFLASRVLCRISWLYAICCGLGTSDCQGVFDKWMEGDIQMGRLNCAGFLLCVNLCREFMYPPNSKRVERAVLNLGIGLCLQSGRVLR